MHKVGSIKLFEIVKNSEIICVFSDLTERELENAPEIVKNDFLSISIHHREMVSVTEDAYNLAENYINPTYCIRNLALDFHPMFA